VSTPTSIPAAPLTGVGRRPDDLWHSSFRAMASAVRVQLGLTTPRPAECHAQVRALFDEVERQCTRFDPGSDLMRANAAGDAWQPVGDRCFAAIEAAAQAHVMTGGRFDPRVLRTLADLGYTTSLAFAEGDLALPARTTAHQPARPKAPWSPGFDRSAGAVRVGPEPVDLGGIGKGLALRWSGDLLHAAGADTFLVDAGGDCLAAGAGPDATGWRIGVEDPAGGSDPVAVLSVQDAACATSSVRLRHWRVGADDVHHLIDPSTGRPGGAGLRSVTVVAPDPARAEVWSKTLFLYGELIGSAARKHGLAALWVYANGSHEFSTAMTPHVIWRRR
jgi:thiamine biosynthesis lipoprotein